MTNRRDFLKTGVIAGGAIAGGAALTAVGVEGAFSRLLASEASAHGLGGEHSTAPLHILILGGTGFIGPHLVRHAVSRGHKVTTFTRGRREADLPDSVERLTGDRNGQLDSLKGRTWDAVIDDSATNPDWVRQSTELLKGSAGRYLFTSSTGVYYPYLKRGLDESDKPHLEMADPKDGSESFGVNKANCEQLVQAAFGDTHLVVRPTYIVGPGDTTDRFPYWPVRLAKGGDVLAPGQRLDPVAFIDVRDLAEFYVKLLEDGRNGIYNAVGPATPMTSRIFYETAQATINPRAKLVFIEDYDFLKAHKIEDSVPWVLLAGNDYGHQSVKNAKSVAAGLKFRPLAQTLKDTLAWWPSVPQARRDNPRWAISAATEAQALADWKARG
jgi:2'-hydroxyisoflavone reductase